MVATMKMIAAVNLKGGVGKTTAVILIATQLVELGHTVTVLDMDSQGSATDWARIADEDGTPLPFEVRPANTPASAATSRLPISPSSTRPPPTRASWTQS